MKTFRLRTKTVWMAGLLLLACCRQGAAQTFNTSSDLLIRGQSTLVESPLIAVFSTNLVQVTTNRQVLGMIPSYARENTYTASYSAPPAPPNQPLLQISTDGGATWSTSVSGTNCLLSVLHVANSFYLTNLIVRGYSHKFQNTNDLSGQYLFVDNPTYGNQAANKHFVDAGIAANVPHDWSAYPATNTVEFRGNSLFWNTSFSTTTDSSTNISQTFRVYGIPLLQFDSSTTTGGSNIVSQIAVTDTTVTIRVATNGVASRPVVYTTPDLIAGNWLLASTVTTVTESYPGSTGGYFTITFPRLAGDNFFTVYLASSSDFQRIRTRVPLRIEAGMQLATNYVAADFIPIPGYITFPASNNAVYSVSTTKTNLIVAP